MAYKLELEELTAKVDDTTGRLVRQSKEAMLKRQAWDIAQNLDRFLSQHHIVKKDIQADPACLIGFSEQEQRWYGWSKHLILGFGVGDLKFLPARVHGEYAPGVIINLDEARISAMNFSLYCAGVT